MSILITGGLGFVGSHLTKFLLDNSDDMIKIIDNFSTGSRSNLENLLLPKDFHRVEIIEESVEKISKLEMSNISIIFHLASHASPLDFYTHPKEIMSTNSIGTKSLLELALKNDSVFILASTSEIYGDPLEHPQTEDYFGNVNTLGVRACYDESKRFAEALTMIYSRENGLDSRILRIFNTYGSNMNVNDGRVVPTFIWQALQNKSITIRGDGYQTRSFCYISDLIKGIHLISRLDKPIHNAYNIGNPNETSILELAKIIRNLLNSNSRITFIEGFEDDPKRRRPDIRRLSEETGWVPKVSLEDGLRLTIPYYKNELKKLKKGEN